MRQGRPARSQAGVAEATIFRHFNTKKELLLRLTVPVAKKLIPAAVEDFKTFKRQADGGFAAFATASMKSGLDFARRYWPILRIIAHELLFQPDLRVLLAERLQPSIASLEREIGAF